MRSDPIRSIRTLALGFTLALGLAACDDDPEAPEETVFAAELAGASEVPPVETDASGTATFTVSGTTVEYEIEVSSLVDVFAAHIHMGGATENGGIVVGLFQADPAITIEDGLLVEGQFAATDVMEITFQELVDLMESGQAYVNVHTMANPGGEIRGQIQLQ